MFFQRVRVVMLFGARYSLVHRRIFMYNMNGIIHFWKNMLFRLFSQLYREIRVRMIERYHFSVHDRSILESMRQPFAIYQFIDRRVVTLVLSDGFCELFGYKDRAQAYYDMENDMYKDTHPDDKARVADAAFRFTSEGGRYEAIYRTRNKKGPGYIVVHAMGEHVYMDDGARLAQIWYTDEGAYIEDAGSAEIEIAKTLSNKLHEQSARKIAELTESVSSLLTNMPAMTFSKDMATGRYLACNQAFAAYAGKENLDGVIGLTDFEIFDLDTAAHFVEDNKKVMGMEAPYVFLEDVPDAAGCRKQFQTTKLKFIDSAGRQCLLGMCQDVTDAVSIRRENATTKEAYEKARDTSVIYTHLAHALARGYTELYYVNMETGAFIEYHTDDSFGVLTEARRGTDFFENCERDVKLFVHPDDQAAFVQAMNRSFLQEALERNRVYEMTYRWIKEGRPLYVQMRVSRMEDDKRFIVIAVSDIDELMRQRRAEERIQAERVVYARLHALTGNFIVVYVVDPETNRYREFSATNDYVESFAQAKDGEKFFDKVREVARSFNHPDDLKRFLSAFTKENIMAEIERNGIFTLEYRLIMENKPLHVQMKAAMVEEKEGSRLIVGLNDIDAQYRQREIDKEIARQKEVFDQLTASLAEQYDTLYYIDIASSTYIEISSTDEYKKLNVPATGNDFFAESRRSIRKYVHPEDQEKVLRLHYKDVMLKNLKDGNSFSMAWRLVVNDQVKNIRHTEIMSRDKEHIIVCIKNIDAEVQAELALKADQKKSVTYTQIAERLADHYDLIYYIDCVTSNYAELSIKKKSGELRIQEEGKDFFKTTRKNTDRLIYSEDRNRIKLFLDRDHLISQLETRRQLTEDYRMVIDGGKTQYTRMSVTYSSDHSHFIICVENREEDVRRENEHLAALSMANEIARRDELTHTKNKTAYHEMENELQKHIEERREPFGIVVCDING